MIKKEWTSTEILSLMEKEGKDYLEFIKQHSTNASESL